MTFSHNTNADDGINSELDFFFLFFSFFSFIFLSLSLFFFFKGNGEFLEVLATMQIPVEIWLIPNRRNGSHKLHEELNGSH